MLEATVQAFLDGLSEAGAASVHALPFEAARSVLARMQAGPVAAPSVAVSDLTLPVGPTGSVGVRILRPADANGAMPIVIYLHGGCWVMGGKESHDRLARELAAGAEAAIVLVEYALAPEACYPVQNEQAYAVLEYVAGNAGALGLDASRIAVAGDCAGGNMAAALALLAKRRRGPEIAFQLLFYPTLGEPAGGGSYETFKDGPWLTREAMGRALDAVFPDAAGRREITAFPLRAPLVQLNDLPEALVIVAENDVVRDEGEAYARRLTEAGVSATCTRYNGTIHDFVVLNALAGAPATRSAISQAAAGLTASFYRG
ncbi:MAG TPA: alpha/beta hydrolase [Acetobacteraceae bacterium]|nr:alpha/beta hydrolase [Acetobacteraceae bacterium]